LALRSIVTQAGHGKRRGRETSGASYGHPQQRPDRTAPAGAGPAAEGDRIAFKNLARQAVEELRARGRAAREVDAIEEELDDLHDDEAFWTELSHSLAVFASPGGLRGFRLPNRLTEAVQVADRYYVKPLLRAVTFPQTAFVLALAEGSVRLLEVTPDLPTFEVRVPDLPSDAASAAGKASITDRSPASRCR
jgi:hypothetical protein